ncbi:RNA-directed DNA polymerase, eukaryota, partial [Tanacetum coccineum]
GSILSLLDELVKVGQVMGYNMDGCLAQKAKKDWVKELCVRNKVNFLALQETKMENMDLICVKTCWGNLGTRVDLLMIAVYASHDFKDKQLLWDYLTREIGKWKREVVIMGAFNKVRHKSDRFGSVFNVQGANMFNSFITNAGLVKVSLLSTWPNITAVTLERYLSDHRPILLRESHFDYGPTPFRFFHYWFEMEGFTKIVEDAWREYPRDESNAMINMMGKLKYLKTKIQEWNKTNMLCVKNVKAKYWVDLEDVEAIIDNGNGNEEVVNKRAEIVNCNTPKIRLQRKGNNGVLRQSTKIKI